VRATLEEETLALVSVDAGSAAVDGQALSLESAAQMYALWRGLSQSLPQLPLAGVEGAMISHPGYEE